ncbi:MAG: uracil-DNA glycosylase [Methylobacter sp.]|nr:uracil-DNA glycosylase [Methylobacter sp.]
MDNATRLQYLEAMGIDVWLSRVALDSGQSPTFAIADSWEALQAEVATCRLCDLCEQRSQSVFGSGNKNADWVFIGEAPGHSEDQQGLPSGHIDSLPIETLLTSMDGGNAEDCLEQSRPPSIAVVGNAGQLLTEMLRAIGLEREQVFISNIVKCRPPDNREPKAREIETCKPYLLRQLALIRPKIIVILGHVAAQALLNTDAPISELRGKIHALNETPVVVVYHPAYLLRAPLDKRKAWADLKLAVQTVKNIKG